MRSGFSRFAPLPPRVARRSSGIFTRSRHPVPRPSLPGLVRTQDRLVQPVESRRAHPLPFERFHRLEEHEVLCNPVLHFQAREEPESRILLRDSLCERVVAARPALAFGFRCHPFLRFRSADGRVNRSVMMMAGNSRRTVALTDALDTSRHSGPERSPGVQTHASTPPGQTLRPCAKTPCLATPGQVLRSPADVHHGLSARAPTGRTEPDSSERSDDD